MRKRALHGHVRLEHLPEFQEAVLSMFYMSGASFTYFVLHLELLIFDIERVY